MKSMKSNLKLSILTSSDFQYGMAIQKFHRLLIEGFSNIIPLAKTRFLSSS
jgi:hypothetical protein